MSEETQAGTETQDSKKTHRNNLPLMICYKYAAGTHSVVTKGRTGLLVENEELNSWQNYGSDPCINMHQREIYIFSKHTKTQGVFKNREQQAQLNTSVLTSI